MSADLAVADLDLVRLVAQTGTLSAAARALGVDQTTAARRLARLEKQLGAPLFDRHGQRSVPTPLLAEALPDIATMAAAATRASAALARRRAELAGTVRVTSVTTLAARVLAPALADLTARHAGLTVEFDASATNLSVGERAADIALRLGRGPEDHAVITRLGALRFHLYRRRDSAGRPSGIVAYTANLAATPEMRLLARLRPDAAVLVRSDRLDVLLAAALATGAEVMLPGLVGDAEPALARVEDDGLIAEREVFRLVHPERRRDRAVAAVTSWVDATVRAALAWP